MSASASIFPAPDGAEAVVPRWGRAEIALSADGVDDPFGVSVAAVFTDGETVLRAPGFYDGGGIWRVRFMPPREGRWSWTTESAVPALAGASGGFRCGPPEAGVHGPVRAAPGDRGFDHADGTPFFAMGTTAYAWIYRPEEVRRRTLDSLVRCGFNKLRMCVFPKVYGDGKEIDISYEPAEFPFAGAPRAFDFSSFNPSFFRSLEERLDELADRGIEADLILFHPYDDGRWGIAQGMDARDDLRYVEYAAARLSSFRNVWWSLANEYDLFSKDWDAVGARLAELDPYGHPRSIHNWAWGPVYPDRPWMTHVSYQHPNTFSRVLDLRARYGKPVVNDEYQYEGDVSADWGNCAAETEFRRHWTAVMAGGYATHGEVLKVGGSRKDYFWAYGGELRGGSAPRLRFMRELMESLPFRELEVYWPQTDGRDFFCLHRGDELYFYFVTPEYKDRGRLWIGGAPIDPSVRYRVDVYDLWEGRKARSFWATRAGNPGATADLPPWAALVAAKET